MVGPPSSPNCPRIQLPMTDRDVVERAAKLFDRRVWRSDRGIDRGYKPAFLTAIKGAAAVHLMTALRPLMGSRRRSQIDRALARPHNSRIRWHRPSVSCAVAACARPARTKGLCKIHYHTWWKSTKRGRTPRHVPVDPPLPAAIEAVGVLTMPSALTPNALAWLAGLLEGEGTFEAHRQRSFRYPRVAVSMCDEDVVARVSALIGSRSVWRQEPREGDWSPTFGTAVTGARGAELMVMLLPHMGGRRSTEIRLALEAYAPIRITPAPTTCAVPKCDRPHEARGLCHRHHMQWWRDRRGGREPRVTPLR